jgi:hypothetical protein
VIADAGCDAEETLSICSPIFESSLHNSAITK